MEFLSYGMLSASTIMFGVQFFFNDMFRFDSEDCEWFSMLMGISFEG